MQLKVGDKIYNRVPAHYYKNHTGEVKKVTNTEIIVEYTLNELTVNIHHNIYDLKYLEVV